MTKHRGMPTHVEIWEAKRASEARKEALATLAIWFGIPIALALVLNYVW